MLYPRGRLLIFAKAPVAGLCKTRLAKRFGQERAAAIYRRLLERTVAMAAGSQLAPTEICCAPDTQHPFLRSLSREHGLALRRQSQGNLGRKMQRALSSTLRQADYAIIIGGDCPILAPEHLDDAFAALHDGDDAVFAPTEDGGYALIGTRSAPARLFRSVPWGSSSVMRRTRQHLKSLDMRWTRLDTLWDVDEPQDYIRALRAGLLQG